MALNFPSNLYSGAAQVFDNRPHLAFQSRLLQQFAAKQQALDDYYRRLPLTINEKGVRDQERPLIADSLLGIKKFYIDNKDRIRQGDQAAAYNYEKMVREHQDLVGTSQNRGLTELQLGKLFLNPKTSYISQNRDFMDKVAALNKPINDPEHSDVDLDEMLLPPEPYNRTTYFKDFGSLKGNDRLIKTKNPDGLTETISNSPVYGESQKQFVMEVAGDKYLHDRSFKDMVDNDLGVPNNTNPLNEDFKEHFGNDIQTPIDLATAYTFRGLKPLPITQKIQVDRGAMLDKQTGIAFAKMKKQDEYIRNRMQLAQGMREATIDYKSAKSTQEQEGVLNQFIKTTYDTGTDKINGKKIEGVDIGGKLYKGRLVDVPKELKYEFAEPELGADGKPKIVDGKYVPMLPNAYYITDDKKTFIPLFFGSKTTTGGNFIKTQSKPRDIQLLKLPLSKLLLTKKATGSEVVDEFAGDEQGGFIPEMQIETKEVKKTSKSTKTKKSAADYGL